MKINVAVKITKLKHIIQKKEIFIYAPNRLVFKYLEKN